MEYRNAWQLFLILFKWLMKTQEKTQWQTALHNCSIDSASMAVSPCPLTQYTLRRGLSCCLSVPEWKPHCLSVPVDTENNSLSGECLCVHKMYSFPYYVVFYKQCVVLNSFAGSFFWKFRTLFGIVFYRVFVTAVYIRASMCACVRARVSVCEVSNSRLIRYSLCIFFLVRVILFS